MAIATEIDSFVRTDSAIFSTQGRLDALLSSFELIDTNPVHILRMQNSARFNGRIDYHVTRAFMKRVAEAGNQEAGIALFVEEDPTIRQFQEVATSGKAIDMILHLPAGADLRKWKERILNTEAARSVVDRKMLVRSVLTAHGVDLLKSNSDRTLTLVSIGSGWGENPLDVMGDIDNEPEFSFTSGGRGHMKVVLVDPDPKAIKASRDLAVRRKLSERVETIQKPYLILQRTAARVPHSVELIESTGLTDYFGDDRVRQLLRITHDLVSADGIVVVTNIISRREEEYLDRVWGKMIRRTPVELANLAISAGFDRSNVMVLLDPSMTMGTVVAKL